MMTIEEFEVEPPEPEEPDEWAWYPPKPCGHKFGWYCPCP